MASRQRRGELVLEGQGTNYKDRLVYYEGMNLVGRNPLKTTITIKDRSISEIHGKIICKNNSIKIVDMKSKNGIYINSLEDQIQPDSQIQIDPSRDWVYFAQIKCRFLPDTSKGHLQEDTKQFTVKANIGQNIKKPSEQNQNKKREQDKGQIKKGQEKDTKLKVVEVNSKKDGKQTKKDSEKQKKQKEKQLLRAILAEQELSNKNKIGKADIKNQKKIPEQPIKKDRDEIQKKQEVNNNKSRQKLTEDNKNKPLPPLPADKKKQEKVKANQKKIQLKNENQKAKDNQEKNSEKSQQIKNLSCQTKPDHNHLNRIKNKSENKARGKNKDKERETNKKLKNRKILPEQLPSQDDLQPRRSALWITALLSGFSLRQKPSSKINVTTNWKDTFEVLVMQKYSRTFKLLYSICLGIPIVNRDWIIQSERKRGPAGFERFFLQSQSKDLIANSVKQVKNGKKVFKGLKFHLVGSLNSFHLPAEQIEALILAGGGQLLQKVSKNEGRKDIVFIVQLKYGSEELKELKKIERVEKAYTVQMILDSCQKQLINWDANKVQKF